MHDTQASPMHWAQAYVAWAWAGRFRLMGGGITPSLTSLYSRPFENRPALVSSVMLSIRVSPPFGVNGAARTTNLIIPEVGHQCKALEGAKIILPHGLASKGITASVMSCAT